MIYAEGKKVCKVHRQTLLLSHQVWTEPPCFPNSFSERSLGAAGSGTDLRPQQFMSKEYVCVFTV